MNLKDKKLLFIIAGALTVLLAVGGTYAWLTSSQTSQKRNVLHAGTLSLKLDNETENGISLTNAYPMTEQEGLNTTVYEFSLVNDGTMDSNYSIYLDDMDLSEGKTRMDNGIVKYHFQKNEEQATTGTVESLGENTNRVLDSGVIPAGETINYKLQVWMDYEADNSQQGTTFKANLRVEASQVTSSNP